MTNFRSDTHGKTSPSLSFARVTGGATRAIDMVPLSAYAWFMQVELTPEQAAFIALGIQEGRFRDSEEAVRIALAQWEKRERTRTELLTTLDAAEQALDAGEGREYSVETLSDLVEAVRQRGTARMTSR